MKRSKAHKKQLKKYHSIQLLKINLPQAHQLQKVVKVVKGIIDYLVIANLLLMVMAAIPHSVRVVFPIQFYRMRLLGIRKRLVP